MSSRGHSRIWWKWRTMGSTVSRSAAAAPGPGGATGLGFSRTGFLPARGCAGRPAAEVAVADDPHQLAAAAGPYDDRHAPNVVTRHSLDDRAEPVAGFHPHPTGVHDVLDPEACSAPCGTVPTEQPQKRQLVHHA